MLMVIGDRSFLDADDEDDIVYVGCATIGLSIGTSPIDTFEAADSDCEAMEG